MSKGHPYRYHQNPYYTPRSKYCSQDVRHDIGPPNKRQRHSSGNDFTIFSYEDCHQDVGLGNFNDFSAIRRDAILPRDHRRDTKLSRSNLPIETCHTTTSCENSSTKVSSHSVNVAVSDHTQNNSVTNLSSNSSIPQSQSYEKHEHHQPRFKNYQSAEHKMTVNSSMSGSSQTDVLQANSVDLNSKNGAKIIKSENVYKPQIEAVSPSNSENEREKPLQEDNEKRSNELLKQMEKVDKDISEVTQKITDLKDKQKLLKDDISQEPLLDDVSQEPLLDDISQEPLLDNTSQEPLLDNISQESLLKEVEDGAEKKIIGTENENSRKNEVEVQPGLDAKEISLIERIYQENKKKAAIAHEQFAKIGIPFPNALPLYNQPSDLPFYAENRKKARSVQLKLVKYFQRKRKDRQIKQRALLQQYRLLQKKWLEKVEKMENNQKRKNKEARVREFYEKIFPEMKRHREQTERFSRIGSRANWGMSARSDAEYEEILRNLEEKEKHEKHMRQLAVQPPPLLDEHQRKIKYINRNGLIRDMKTYVEQRKMLNIWTEKETETFKEKYVEAPKDFEYISSFLPNKNVKDCILHYYRTKRKGNFKKLVKKQPMKRKRLQSSAPVKDETAKSRILKPRHEGETSDPEIEENEGFEVDSDGTEDGSSQIPVSSCTIDVPQVNIAIQTGECGGSETPRWSKNEREIAIDGLRLHGRNWLAISQMVKTKTEAQCKNFYFNYKRKLDLENVVAEHNAAKIVHRQESEETMSASEPSDDDYEITGGSSNVARLKQNLREGPSDTTERRVDFNPSERTLRSQRSSNNNKPFDVKSSLQDTIKLHEAHGPSTLSTADSDDAGIIVVDVLENPECKEKAVNCIGSNNISKISTVQQSTSMITETGHPSLAVKVKDRKQPFEERHMSLASPSTFTNVLTSTASTLMYPSVPYRPLTLDTPISGGHSKLLLNLARNVTTTIDDDDDCQIVSEERNENSEKDKPKKIRFPDPQLPKFEQSEAIGIFSRFSPCIPPDTTSRQQVRSQRLPHPPFHPHGIPVHPFLPHIAPPRNPYLHPEMYAVPIPHGPNFDPMFHPVFREHFFSGMDPNIFSLPLRHEVTRSNPGGIILSPLEHRRIFSKPPPPYMLPIEHLAKVRESGNDVISSSASSSRSRSVETSTSKPRAMTPDHIHMESSKVAPQKRSSSLTDVRSMVALSALNESNSNQVTSFGPLTALVNAAAKAKPINHKPNGRDLFQCKNDITTYEATPGLVKDKETTNSYSHFTRQSCVVTNTTVLHVSSSATDSNSRVHGISSGRALPQPPPLLSITGTPSFKDTSTAKYLETTEKQRSNKLMASVEMEISEQKTVSEERVAHRQISTVRNPSVSQTLTPSISHCNIDSSKPPRYVRDSPFPNFTFSPFTTSTEKYTIQKSILTCGCRTTEPCRHQLYSQEVPYVEGGRKHEGTISGLEFEQPYSTKALFRPWAEDNAKVHTLLPSSSKTICPPLLLNDTTGVLVPSQTILKRSSNSSYTHAPGGDIRHSGHQQVFTNKAPLQQTYHIDLLQPSKECHTSGILQQPIQRQQSADIVSLSHVHDRMRPPYLLHSHLTSSSSSKSTSSSFPQIFHRHSKSPPRTTVSGVETRALLDHTVKEDPRCFPYNDETTKRHMTTILPEPVHRFPANMGRFNPRPYLEDKALRSSTFGPCRDNSEQSRSSDLKKIAFITNEARTTSKDSSLLLNSMTGESEMFDVQLKDNKNGNIPVTGLSQLSVKSDDYLTKVLPENVELQNSGLVSPVDIKRCANPLYTSTNINEHFKSNESVVTGQHNVDYTYLRKSGLDHVTVENDVHKIPSASFTNIKIKTNDVISSKPQQLYNEVSLNVNATDHSLQNYVNQRRDEFTDSISHNLPVGRSPVSESNISDELSQQDGTFLPTDSTYIENSEPSLRMALSNKSSNSSSDVVDSTVSDISDVDQCTRDRKKLQETPTHLRKLNVESGIAENKACSFNERSMIEVQDETISGHEGDDDLTTEDDNDDSKIKLIHQIVEEEEEETQSDEVGSSNYAQVMNWSDEDSDKEMVVVSTDKNETSISKGIRVDAKDGVTTAQLNNIEYNKQITENIINDKQNTNCPLVMKTFDSVTKSENFTDGSINMVDSSEESVGSSVVEEIDNATIVKETINKDITSSSDSGNFDENIQHEIIEVTKVCHESTDLCHFKSEKAKMATFHDGDDCTNEYVTSSDSSGVNKIEKTIAKEDLVSVKLLSSEDEGKQEKEKYEERLRDGKVDNHNQDKKITDYEIDIIEEINQCQSDDHMTSLSSQSHSDDHMTIVSNQSHNDDHMTLVPNESHDDDHMSSVSNQSPSVDHMTSNELTEEQTDDVSTSYLAKNEIKEKPASDITSSIVSINQLSQSHEDASSMSRETHTIRNADITSSTNETSSLDLTCDTAEGANQSTNSRIPNSVASSSSDEKISANHFNSSHITSSAEHPVNVVESDSWNNFSESVQDDNNSQIVNDKSNRTENENELVSCGSFLAEQPSNKNAPFMKMNFEEITSDSEIQTTTLDKTRTVNDDTDSIENGNRNEAHTFEYVTEGSSKEFSHSNKAKTVDSSTVSPVSFTDEVHSNLDTPEYVETNANDTASSIGDNIGYFGRNENTFNKIVGNIGCLSIPEGTVGSTLGVISSTSYDITVEAISSDEELEEGEISEIPNKVSSVDDISVPNNASEHVISSSGLFYPPLDTIPISPPACESEMSSSFKEFTTFTITSSEDVELTTQRREAPIQTTGLLSVFPFFSLNIRSASNSNNSSPNPLGFSSSQSTDPIPNMFQPADSTDISMLTPQYEPLSDDDS